MEITRDIGGFFAEKLSDLKCQGDTRAYIAGIYVKYRTSRFDLSKNSITLLLAQGKYKQDFATYQNLGDWIFFSNTMVPEYVGENAKDYYDTVARISYYSCYRLINRQWKLFEELADNLLFLEQEVKRRLSSLTMGSTYSDDHNVIFSG